MKYIEPRLSEEHINSAKRMPFPDLLIAMCGQDQEAMKILQDLMQNGMSDTIYRIYALGTRRGGITELYQECKKSRDQLNKKVSSYKVMK